MNKERLVSLISTVISPLKFKRKGNNWTLDNGSIIKLISLQQSNYGKVFYIDYGYNLKNLPLEGLKMHLYKRFIFSQIEEKGKYFDVLDLDNDLSDNKRISEIINGLSVKWIGEISSINTEDDILSDLKKRPNLNSVPLIVKDYFKGKLQS